MIKETTYKANFVIKFNPDNNVRTGFMKTKTEKFYLGEDGILSIVPLGTSDSSFCGVFEDGALTNIPPEYLERVTRRLEKLTYMFLVLKGKAN